MIGVLLERMRYLDAIDSSYVNIFTDVGMPTGEGLPTHYKAALMNKVASTSLRIIPAMFRCLIEAVALASCVALISTTTDRLHAAEIDFLRDIQPILKRNCYRCHAGEHQEAGLLLDRVDSLMGTSDSAELILVPHRPDESLLVQRIADDHAGDIMPLDGNPLDATSIELIRVWIEQGAALPDDWATGEHWAYAAARSPTIPELDQYSSAIARNPIDHFIAARLASENLRMSAVADPATLARRVSLALTGLPATPQQLREFQQQPTNAAYEALVDELLATPAFGQHWARHWLDLARYADSNGFQADQLRDAWAYRDWVIDALNADMPFDQFVIEQLAGDLLPNANESNRIATGFHRTPTCNVEAGVQPEANRVNQVFDRVNTTATVFLGTSLECAQCHDHKYDPFTQADYYRMFAYFNNTPLEVKQTAGVTYDFVGPKMTLTMEADAALQLETLQSQLVKLKEKHQDFDVASDPKAAELERKIKKVQAAIQRIEPPTTLVMTEIDAARETFIMQRGDYLAKGETVSTGTPDSLHPLDESLPKNRLGLAKWITDPGNPLLSRVTVNRFWMQLFGRGIVTTPEDFGTQSEPPSHPELLDWLSLEFQNNGWSVKQLLKTIVMSATFRQDSRLTSELLERDPDNVLLARGPRYRLPAEMIRDNALAVSGLLSMKAGGPPVMPYQPDGIWRAVGRNQPKWQAAEDEHRYRRGIYVVWKRSAPYPSFVTFDAPDRASCTVSRPRTNTPLQALVLLNDQAYTEAAMALATRMIRESPLSDPAEIIKTGYTIATAQTADERAIGMLVDLYQQELANMIATPTDAKARYEVLPVHFQDSSVQTTELAAWYAVASVLLNLDVTITLH